MSGQQPQANRHDFEATLIARVWKDPKFADELRRNPKAVVERELAAVNPGTKLPADATIKVLEETPTTIYLIVPPKPQRVAELSDAELTQIAGGATIWDSYNMC